MELILKEDIPTGNPKTGKVYYAKKGDKVILVTDSHHPVLIVSDLKGDRFPVFVTKTNYEHDDTRSDLHVDDQKRKESKS